MEVYSKTMNDLSVRNRYDMKQSSECDA